MPWGALRRPLLLEMKTSMKVKFVSLKRKTWLLLWLLTNSSARTGKERLNAKAKSVKTSRDMAFFYPWRRMGRGFLGELILMKLLAKSEVLRGYWREKCLHSARRLGACSLVWVTTNLV